MAETLGGSGRPRCLRPRRGARGRLRPRPCPAPTLEEGAEAEAEETGEGATPSVEGAATTATRGAARAATRPDATVRDSLERPRFGTNEGAGRNRPAPSFVLAPEPLVRRGRLWHDRQWALASPDDAHSRRRRVFSSLGRGDRGRRGGALGPLAHAKAEEGRAMTARWMAHRLAKR